MGQSAIPVVMVANVITDGYENTANRYFFSSVGTLNGSTGPSGQTFRYVKKSIDVLFGSRSVQKKNFA